MDEKLIDQLYSRATSLGYKKSRDEFASLIKTDDDVYNDMFSYAQSSGLVSDSTQFGTMVGRFQAPYKKKEEPALGLPEQMFQTKPQAKPEPQLRVSSTPVPRGEQRQQAKQRAATELPSEAGLSVSAGTEQPLKPSVGIVAESTAMPKIDVKAIQEQKAYEKKIADETPKEVPYFTGTVGTVLSAIDSPYSPVGQVGVGDFIDDMGRAIASGLNQGDITTPANVLLLTGKNSSPDQIKKYVSAVKDYEKIGASEEMIKFSKTYQDEGKTIYGFLKGLAENPGVIGELIVSSATAMLNPSSLAAAGAVTGGFAAAGAAGAAPGAAAGALSSIPWAIGAAGTALETGLTFSELLKERLQERNLEFTEENVKTILEDEKALNDIRTKSLARGATIGAVDALTGRLAGKVGAKLLGNTPASRVKAGLAGAGVEMVGGSIGEAAGRVVAGQELDVAEIGLEGIAEGPMAIADVTAEVLRRPIYKVNGERRNESDIETIINTASPEDLYKIDIDIKNDVKGYRKRIQDIIVDDQMRKEIRQANPNVDDATINTLLGLEKELKTFENNKTQSGKDRAAAIRSQIKKIQQDAVQEQAAGQVPVQPTTGVGQEVAQGEPKAGPEGVTAEGVTTKEQISAPITEKEVVPLGEQQIIQNEKDGQPTTTGPIAGNRLFNKPLETVKEIANRYYQRVFGTERPKYAGTRKLDEERGKRIADAYTKMKDDPTNPEVRAAYDALSKETLDQYKDFVDSGFTIEIDNEEPYANSQEMIDDLRNNNRIKIFSTEAGFGSTGITEDQRQKNPLLKDSGFKDSKGNTLLVNDVFRAIHDFYGHAELGNSFGPKGEENAWNVHARMFSPLARRAMTTETRGQNSYVNFSGVNERIDKLREEARKLRDKGDEEGARAIVDKIYQEGLFAEQKIGLLPEEFSQIDEKDLGDIDLVQGKPEITVKAQVEMVQFPTATTTLETEGTGVITEGVEPVFKGSNAPTVNLSTDTQERYAEDYTADEIETSEHTPSSRVVSVASNLGTGQVTYTKQGEKKTFSLPFINTESTKKIQSLRKKYKAVKGSSKAAKEQKAKLKAEINAESKKVLADFKNTMVQNLLALYDSLTPDFVAKSKQWYVGANRMAQAIAQKYNISIDQVGGIIAALSPQNDWFNNVSVAERAIEVMTKYADTKLTKAIVDKAVAYNTDSAGERNSFAQDILDLFSQYGEVSINELQSQGLSPESQSAILRAFDQALHSPKVAMTDPEGKFVGFDKTPVRWNSNTEIAKAISIFRNGSIENINSELGGGNKVRNFYNNIVDPDSETPYLTADTHALSAALNSPISAEDASGIGLFNGGAEPLYALVKAAYIDAARIAGIKPREMQSITWEAQRIGINDKSRTEDKKNETFQYITESRTNNQTPYERATELIARNRSANPSWGAGAGIETQKSSDAIREGAKLRAEQRAREISALRGPAGERVGATPAAVGGAVTGRAGVTETVKEQKGVPLSNQTLMEEIESRAAKDERVKAVVAAAKKAIATLKSIIPNAQIYLYENAEDYNSFAKSVGSAVASRGLFTIMKDDSGNTIVRIDINLSSANPTTVYHEVAHAVMYKAFGDNKKLFNKFRDQISSVLSKSAVEELNKFASLYKDESSSEEWLVQFSALMADQGKQIPISTFQKIADIVNKIVSQITNGAIVPFKEVVSKKEIIDFFNQMSDSIRRGEQISVEAAKISPAETVVKTQVGQPVSELPGYDKLMDDVTNTLIPNAIKRKMSGEEMIKMIKKFVAKSDIYKVADDIQRDELVRQINGMLDEAYKNPPSAQRLLGLIQDPIKITMTEKQLFAKQIMDQAKAAKNVKKLWMKTSQEMASQLKKMAAGGRITINQAAAIIRRMSFVNMLDENSVNSFVDYMAKVFKNAEYAQQIANVRKLLRNAKRNAETKIGVANELKPLLRQVFAINPSLIPDNVFEKYAGLVEMMGERAAVLTLEDATEVRKMAEDIMGSVNAELSLVDTLADVFDSYQDKVLDDDGKVMYSDTINKMVDEGKITTSDAEILRKYKSTVMPAEPATPMTEQEIADEKKQLEDFVMDSEIDETSLPSRDERDAARKLNALIKTAGVGSLTNTELKNLLKVIANINNGYFPHYAQIMTEKIESANNNKEVTKFVETAKPLPISKIYARIKKLFVKGKDTIALMVERNPIQYIEQIFGDFKTDTLKKNLFDPIAKAFSNYENEYNKILNKIKDVENSLSNHFKKDGNKITMSKYKMMTYMLQLENDSNPGSKEVAPAMDFLNKTINEIESGETNFTERDAEMLQEIATKFDDGSGNIDINKLYNSFSEAEKNAIKELQNINASLSDKAAYTANVIRGQKFTPLNNYIHHSVIAKSSPTDDATGASLVDQFNASRMPSTRAKSLTERTRGAKPISFDVLDSVSFAAKGQLMDYHLTSVIRTGRRTIDAAKKAARKMGKEKKEIMNAIAGAYERAVETVLVNSYVKSTFADDVVRVMSRQGYRAVLAGTSRFISELASNVSFVMAKGRKYFTEGLKMKDIVMSADGATAMRNLNSKMTNRVYSSDTQSGNFIDRNIMKQAVGVSGSRAKSDIANKLNQIYSRTLKKPVNFIEATADTLISTPDKIVMRPAWFGAFSIKFQELTGSKPDFEKIASNDEAYMVQNKQALDEATGFADRETTFIGATDNPFMGILKGTATKDQSGFSKAFSLFNNYMSRFLIYEYSTARTAVNAMVGNGQLSKSEGAALMAAVATRMVVYSFLINLMGTGLIGMLLGDDDEEEENEKTVAQKLGQAVASGAVGLAIGRDFGNVTKNLVNYGVEKINKKYLDFLRDGEYDPYKDAIAFSIIGNEKEGQKSDVTKMLLNMTGPLAPTLKTSYFLAERLARPEPKGEEAKERRQKEMTIRLPLEILGNLGMVPLYKDVRKVVLKEIYKDMEKANDKAKIKKDIEQMLLQGYPNRESMRRYDPELYEQTYGDGGLEDMLLPEQTIKKEIDKEIKRLMREVNDEIMDYTPKEKGKKNSFSRGTFGGGKFGE